MSAALLLAASASAAAAQSEPVATRPTQVKPPVIDSGFVARQDSIDAAEAAAARQPPSCWRARSFCPAFFITDLGVETALLSTRTPMRDFEFRAVWTIGVMGGKGRHAHGAAFSLNGESAGEVPWMLEYRYRNWRGESALDAGIGFKRGNIGPWKIVRRMQGPTAFVGYTPNRWIGIDVRADVLRSSVRWHRDLAIGAKSTMVSEFIFRELPGAIFRAILERMGIETSDEENSSALRRVHDDRARELVVPSLLSIVPQHPEEAKE